MGIGLAVAWLVLATLTCVGNVGLLLTREVAVNAAILTVPLFVSGWVAVGIAYLARHREPRVALGAPALGAGAGLLAGLVLILVIYAVVWPGYWE